MNRLSATQPDSLAKMPASEDAEKSVLSCMMQGGHDVIERVVRKLESDSFYNEPNRILYVHLGGLHLADSPIDIVALSQSIHDAGDIETVGRYHGIESVWHFCPSVSLVDYYADIVAEKHYRRSIVLQCRQLERKALDQSSNHLHEYIQENISFEPKHRARELPRRSMEIESPDNEGSTLLGKRYLCRHGMLLIAGPTGVGKSSLTTQMSILWGLGYECFGFRPSKPIRSLTVQAENDDGDFVEMRDGVLAGLDLSKRDRGRLVDMHFMQHVDDKAGDEFIAALRGYLEQFRQEKFPIDLLVIDPVLSYLGGDSNAQVDVTKFLRNGLKPLLKQYDCGCLLVHHTGKPPRIGEIKNAWKAGDWAYIGTGSGEWANTARAVLAIQSTGDHNLFKLIAGKRGSRIGWKQEDGTPEYERFIAHSRDDNAIYWRDAEQSEIDELEARVDEEGGKSRQEKFPSTELLGILEAGATWSEWLVAARARGWSDSTFRKKARELVKEGRVRESRLEGGKDPLFIPSFGMRSST